MPLAAPLSTKSRYLPKVPLASTHVRPLVLSSISPSPPLSSNSQAAPPASAVVAESVDVALVSWSPSEPPLASNTTATANATTAVARPPINNPVLNPMGAAYAGSDY